MTSIMHGEKYGNDLKTTPLSRETVSHRISASSSSIESVLLNRLKNSPVIALQFNENTGITKLAQLNVYVRYVYETDISEDFYVVKNWKEGQLKRIFENINKYFETNNLTWTRNVAVCTDRASALTGLRELIKKIAPHIVSNHCMIHREALVAKDIDEEFHKILQDVVTVINYIEGTA
ncbi:Zinc finger MYM-type protein 6 [Araneus ventricosus]|uniref:Zinc finger MYM-type protein 6 n=1 Tax=Araneus ventricosus TaxID=182803 RepID=A0A4Y2NMP4_ARAVE|nr:Zinc finger MYM-type protein 6 [Araneus ventricosus]